METMFIFLRYGILIDGSYHNEKKKVPLNPAQIEHYNFQVEKAFEEILKRKTGQIILEGIRATGWYVIVMPYWYDTCNDGTVGRPEMVRGQGVNVAVGFTPDPSCFVDPRTKEFKPGGTPAESLFHELVHAFRLGHPLDWGASGYRKRNSQKIAKDTKGTSHYRRPVLPTSFDIEHLSLRSDVRFSRQNATGSNRIAEGHGTTRTTEHRTDRKIGHNEPCDCGSGKKYKHCCGKPDYSS